MRVKISPLNNIIDDCIDSIPSDKSLSHRSVIFAFLSNKPSRVRNYLFASDTINTLKIAHSLGMRVKLDSNDYCINDILKIKPKELNLIPPKGGIKEPNDVLDCGNAGTAMRLYTGLLASQKGYFILSGDKYLRERPMGRIIKPLQSIGANINARNNNTLAPIGIRGCKLDSFNYHSEISSAQIKSAMILSALNLDSKSYFSEVEKSRDHTERMLIAMGASLEILDSNIVIHPIQRPLDSIDINIPSDPSSAFYFALLAALHPNSKIVLKNILLNETRIEAFKILAKMGANIEFKKRENIYEDIGDIVVCGNELKGVEIDNHISWLIDELPALSIAFACAKGKSIVRNASELRVKESDRIASTINGLRACGVECMELEDGFIIEGGFKKTNKRISINSFFDHRIAMSFAILGTKLDLEIVDSNCVNISFPDFFKILSKFASVEEY